ncbi:hypothetical protein [Paenibacillus sp. R14(2021)]|uniref:hypothetical protein n=1 Tax=Paenibacillus sp. R14(2021) TaxID=2859228 RepID=UPI001C611ECE|nr:hypothetical protein [Paenibacillus sp. R14(2021)]
MNNKSQMKVWIAALAALVIAAVLVIDHYADTPGRGGPPAGGPNGAGFTQDAGGSPPSGSAAQQGEGRGPGGDGFGAGRGPGGGRPPMGEGGLGELFTTLGTIALYTGAAGFSWFWFKKKLKSPSMLIRRAAKLCYGLHKLLGWATLLIIAVHGGYFLVTKIHDDKILTGVGSFVMLLAIAGYGFFITRIRVKAMRLVHRTLSILWVPVLLVHAGGSVLIAVAASAAVGALVWFVDRAAAPSAVSAEAQRE